MKKAIKKFAIILLSVVAVVFGCLALSACSKGGGDNGGNTDNSSAGSLYGKWDEYEGVKIAFADEATYNDGELKENRVLPELNCKLGEKQYMIIDFDIQAPYDNDGWETVTASVQIQPAAAVAATIQDTNTGNVSEETKDDITELKATYKIPETADSVRNMRLVIQLNALQGSEVYIDTSFKKNGEMQAIKTEEVNKKATVEYTQGLIYEIIDDKSYAVTGSYEEIAAQLIIPNMIDGKYVELIRNDAFAHRSILTNIMIPDSVTIIGNCAFYRCGGLESVTIGKGATRIGDEAFYLCNGLKSVAIGNSVEIIGSSAFYSCGLTNITIPDGVKSIESNAFNGCSGLKSIAIPDSVTSIGGGAFFHCSGLTSIAISNSVTMIDYEAFCGCSGLTSITIPDGVTSIDDGAFSYCSGLTSIAIPESVTSIGGGAFSYCSSLKSIVIPDKVSSIGGGAFRDCKSLTYITLPFVGVSKESKTNTHFGYIFGANSYSSNSICVPDSLKEVVLTDSLNIASNAFYNCNGLESITIPNSVTNIGYSAFEGCNGLKSLTLPFVGASKGGKTNTHFGYIFGASTYTNNTDYVPNLLDTVTITDDVGINDYAFYGCSKLTSIIIPNSVTSIGIDAFRWCNGLKSITLPFVGASKEGKTNTHFGYIFGASTYTKNIDFVPNLLSIVTITDGVVIDDNSFDRCYGLTNITIPNSVTSIGAGAFGNCSGLISITIPNSVTSISESAFYGCSKLTSITIPDNVTSIGSYTFSNCSGLQNITIPEGVTSVGEYAFSDCSKLISVALPNSVMSIGSYAFSGCGKLENICVGYENPNYRSENNCILSKDGKNLYVGCKNSVIPNSVNHIENYAFLGCSGLKSILIPYSVWSIGRGAFEGCSGLISITVPYSVDTIFDYAFNRCSGLESIVVESENPNYKSEDNCLLSKDGKTLYAGCKNSIVPNSVTLIYDYAFCGRSELASITIPDDVTSIGNSAFFGCSGLVSITIPESVTSIGHSSFSYCSSLTSITFQGTIAKWKSIVKSSYWKFAAGDYVVHCTDGDLTKAEAG